MPHAVTWKADRSLYDVYLEADYTVFSGDFAQKFKAFEQFMAEHGISYDLEDRTLFEAGRVAYSRKMSQIIGQAQIDRLKKNWKKYEKFYCKYDKIIDRLRKVFGKDAARCERKNVCE